MGVHNTLVLLSNRWSYSHRGLKIIADSRIRSIICKGAKYRFPLPIDFKSCREEIAVESNALNSWKLNIFKIVDGRIPFYCRNLDLLPPKTKFTFRHLKKGVQEFHWRFVDEAANTVEKSNIFTP